MASLITSSLGFISNAKPWPSKTWIRVRMNTFIDRTSCVTPTLCSRYEKGRMNGSVGPHNGNRGSYSFVPTSA